MPARQGEGHVAEILKKLDEEAFEGVLSLEPHLVDFAGLKNLQKDTKTVEMKAEEGERAYRIAYAAMCQVLNRI